MSLTFPRVGLSALLLIFLLATPLPVHADYRGLLELQRQNAARAELEAWLRYGLQRAYGEPAVPPTLNAPLWRRPLAVFVTLKNQQGETRGCMGRLKPQYSQFSAEILDLLEQALRHDPWHARIEREELRGLSIYLTALGPPQAIADLRGVSPAYDAVYLRSGVKGAILLAGEAKTQRYLLAWLKRKAGLRKGERFELYRLPSVTVSLPSLWKS